MKVILCGPPMTGKSYYGQRVAAALHWTFIDTDRLLEERYLQETGEKLTCREIALKLGLATFYLLEKKMIESLASQAEGEVIAIGGGALEREENVKKLKQLGRLIYIKTEPLILLKRLHQRGNIPAYLDSADPEGSFMKLIEKRSAAYERHADLIIPVSQQSDEQVVNTICSYMQKENQ